MKSHIEIIERILKDGEEKRPTRRNSITGKIEPVDGGVSTLSVPNVFWEHDMKDGFPLPTYRRLGLKQVAGELYCFIHGKRSKKEFQEAGCNYWNEWCNPQRINQGLSWEEKKKRQLEEDDLGPIYGVQWREFDGDENQWLEYYIRGFDQLVDIVDKLHNDPHDRRMVCSCWNPNHFQHMALMPCHYSFMVNVTNNKLYLSYQMRSVDFLRGSNTALYGLLLLLLAKEGGFAPGKLSAVFGDCHLYDRDLKVAEEIVARKEECPELPILSITNWDGIFNWKPNDYFLQDYYPLPSIKMPDVVV